MSRAVKSFATFLLGTAVFLASQSAMADPIFDTAASFTGAGVNAPNNLTAPGIDASPMIDNGEVDVVSGLVPVQNNSGGHNGGGNGGGGRTALPEPGTLALFAAGLIGLALLRRRRSA